MVTGLAVLVFALTFGDDGLARVQARPSGGTQVGESTSSSETVAPGVGGRDIVEAFAETLPIGSRVRIQLMDNQTLKGIFFGVDGGHLMIRLTSREPQTALRFASRAIFSLEALDSGASVRKPGVRRR